MSQPINSNILITGASSGIGFQAAKHLINYKDKLILPCRDKNSSKELLTKLQNDSKIYNSNDQEKVDTCVMDLSDLFSIKQFSRQLLDKGLPIDCLVLNAGLQYTGSKTARFSKQGLELTFAVNHLGHQYLTQELLPLLFKSKSPRVIITSSEVHNPNTSGGRIGQPASLEYLIREKDLKRFHLSEPNLSFNADKAYKDSKLCNILFAKELYKRMSSMGRNIPVIAWAPGLVIPRTKKGFFRYSRNYNEIGQKIFAFLARDIFCITEKVDVAGKILASLIKDSRYDIPSFSYYSNNLYLPGKFKFEVSRISEEAFSEELSRKLWELSSLFIWKYEKSNL